MPRRLGDNASAFQEGDLSASRYRGGPFDRRPPAAIEAKPSES